MGTHLTNSSSRLTCAEIARRFLKETGHVISGLNIPHVDTLEELYDLHPFTKLGDPDKRWYYPFHLTPYIEKVEHAKDERLRILLSAPPQHCKTSTGMMLLAFQLLTWPDRRHFFVSYNAVRARRVCDTFCNDILRQLSIPFTSSGGVVKALGSVITFCGISEGITGNTCDGLMMLDDLVKNANEGRSPVFKDRIWKGFIRDVATREWGSSMSIIVVMTRWSVDDLIGRLMNEQGDRWSVLNFKSICEDSDEDPLKRQPGEYLLDSQKDKVNEAKERNERDFFAMFQGEPTVPGLRMFEEATTYSFDELSSANGLTSYYGLDSAYAAKRTSDWSVLVHGFMCKSTGILYIDKVVREQVSIAQFGRDIARTQGVRAGPICWFVGGQEQYASADVLRTNGVKRLECRTARGQLRIRVAEFADLWNAGKIRVPTQQDDVMLQFIDEVVNFTGDDRFHDDCAAALQGLCALAFSGVKAFNTRTDATVDRGTLHTGMPRARTGADYAAELIAKTTKIVRNVVYGRP